MERNPLGAFVRLLAMICTVTIGATPALSETTAGFFTTTGSFDVGDDGSATYTVPIKVPPGAAGMQPKLALTYSSRGGNGPFGVGWSIDGLSAITRCPATVEQDGFYRAPRYNPDDRFCLDGQRLMIKSGNYGADRSEYRTERDTFTQVIAYGQQGNGPEHFIVKTKAGLTMKFGATENSRIRAQGKLHVRVWAVNRITDSVNANNAIEFEYINTSPIDGAYYPKEIHYGGNTVTFTPELRPDDTHAFSFGSQIKSLIRISAIETKTGSTPVLRYDLTYEDTTSTSTKRSRLESIQECPPAGSALPCLEPITFGWSNTAPNTWPAYGNPAGKDNSYDEYAFDTGDFNGDGFPDFIWTKRDAESRVEGGSPLYAWFGGLAGTFTVVTLPYVDYDNYKAHVADFNGDGRSDVLWDKKEKTERSSDGAPRYIWWGQEGTAFSTPEEVSPSTGETLQHYKPHLGEFNGDGRMDILWLRTLGPDDGLRVEDASWVKHKIWLSNGTNTFTVAVDDLVPAALKQQERYQDTHAYLADFNGDGLTDIFWDEKKIDHRSEDKSDDSNTRDLWINTGNAEFEVHQSFGPTSGAFDGYQVQLGDFNGDGNMDLFWYDGWKDGRESQHHKPRYIWFMKGDETFSEVSADSGGGGNQYRPYIGDYNGDGIGDILWVFEDGDRRTQGGNVSTLALGNSLGGFTSQGYVGGYGVIVGWSVFPMDLNGDGLTDLFWDRLDDNGRSEGTQRAMWFNNSKNGVTIPDLLTNVTDGLGATISIASLPITHPYVYVKDTDAVYPFMDFRGPMYVTWFTDTSNGVSGTNRTSYWYRGAEIHHQGRGFNGFRELFAYEPATNLWTRTQYLQQGRFTHGLTGWMETRVHSAPPADWYTSGHPIKRVTNIWDTVEIVPGDIEFPFTLASAEEAWDLDDGSPVKSVGTSQAFDTWGNATGVAVSTVVGGIADGYAKLTENVYKAADEANWILGRLEHTTVTATGPTAPTQVVRTSSFTYDPTTGLLETESVELNDPDNWMTTTYSRDAFGNTETKTVTGADPATGGNIAPRTSTTIYDPVDGKFPETSENALGHTAVREFDPKFGVVKSLTDANGLVTTWDYDDLGRKTKETRPDGTETTWQYLWCGLSGCGPKGVYWTATTSTGKPAVTAVYDMLGREVQTGTFGFLGEPIHKNTEYDALGNVWRGSRNYFAGGTQLWTTFEYDELGRVTEELGPDGSLAETDYDDLCTSVTVYTDPQDTTGQKTTRCKNSQDQIVSVKDANEKTTLYEYDPFGNLTRTIDAAGNSVVMEYDVRGRKTGMVDPDMGEWTYVYDAVGNLREQVSPVEAASQQKTTISYDKLDRQTMRADADGISVWVHDQSPRTSGGVWLGKLWKTGPLVTGAFLREHRYDDLGRPGEVVTTIDGEPFSSGTTYDTAGRVKNVTYPSGFAVENVYNATGYLWQVKNAVSGDLYWEGLEADADLKMTEERLGNGAVDTLRSYNPLDGMLESITSTNTALGDLQELRYHFDWLGNLRWREDLHGTSDLREKFVEYDALNRLKKAVLEQDEAEVSITTFDYDDIGNLTFKGDVGTYTYNANRPHAVANVSGPDAGEYWGDYTYDLNGNMVSSPGRSLTWTAFNNVATITKGAVITSFTYDPDRARYKSETQNGGSIEKTLYVGSLFESVRNGANLTDRHYILAGGAPIAVYTQRNFAAADTRYLLRDHLGSVDAIADEVGAEVERFSYDAWGKRRLVNWLPDGGIPILPLTDVTDRGFTNHEHFELVGVIHMNGRVYDPTLGRFLSPDPFVQAQYQPQNLNRYSYVLNNPLSFTDPSGHFFKKIGKFFKKHGRLIGAIVAAAVVAWAAPYLVGPVVSAILGPVGVTATTLTGGLITGAVSMGLAGASFGAVQTGTWQGAKWGAITAASVYLGGAVASGAIAEARGGNFLQGFLSTGFSAYFGGSIGGESFLGAVGRYSATAVIGGTSSAIGGGKFENGAFTAAFSAAIGEAASRIPGSRKQDLAITDEERKLASEGKRADFWKSRAERGDPLGSTGLAIAENRGFRGVVANTMARIGIAYSGSGVTLDQLGNDLMREHVRAVDVDYARQEGIPGALSLEAVRDYHYAVFDRYNVPHWAYGGTPGGLPVNRATALFYCLQCD